MFVAIARAIEMEYNETSDELKLLEMELAEEESNGTGKVRTLKTTSGGILLGTLPCIAIAVLIIASVVSCVAYSVHVKKDYEAKIESLDREIVTLTEDKMPWAMKETSFFTGSGTRAII